MQIILKKIKIENFKGVKSRTLNFSPHLNIISGDNGTGKTTVIDAFLWCLFGKDSTDRKDFGIKPFGADGRTIERVEVSVELTIEVDRTPIVLKRVLREKWTKPAGLIEQVFSGNETIYFWNDVPLKMSEYQAKIKDIVDEGIFKLLTNVNYFHTLHWEKRREIILSLAGSISDLEILDKSKIENKDIIGSILNSGKSLSEAKIEASAAKSRIKKELIEFSPRIDEAERGKPTPVDERKIKSEIAQLQKEIDKKRAEYNEILELEADWTKKIKSVSEQKQKAVAYHYELKNKYNLLKSKIEADTRSSQPDIAAELSNKRRSLDSINVELTSLSEKLNAAQEKISKSSELLIQKRAEWNTTNAEPLPKFDVNSCNCPYCNQAMPNVNIEDKQAEFERNFNSKKAAKLAEITAEGKEISNLIKERMDVVDKINIEIKNLEATKATLVNDIDRINQSVSAAEPIDTIVSRAVAQSEELFNLLQEINETAASLEMEIADDNTPDNDYKERRILIQKEIDQISEQIAGLNNNLHTNTHIKRIDQRISELKTQESMLAVELLKFEHREFAILQFEKARVEYIETLINDKFKFVSFKMFDELINGSEVPTCITLIDGVPFEDANTASRSNAGIDIINALSNHYDITAPVFIDNAEAVNRYIDTASQAIRLSVSNDNELTFVPSQFKTAIA